MLLSDTSFAEHIAGGSISYTYLGTAAGGNAGRYRITLKLYRDCDSRGAKLDSIVAITIYPNGSGLFYANRQVRLSNVETVSLNSPDPCIGNPPKICYTIGYYTFDITLPFIQKGYVVAYQRCCRIGGIFNIIDSDVVGVTYVAYIPGTEKGANAPINSTPEFKTSDTVVVCADNYFQYDFAAVDADKDELEYVFDEAFSGLTFDNPADTIAQAPEYEPVRYNFGFSGKMPLGTGVSINPATGMISGVAPVKGIYVLTVAVLEKRNGVVINKHRKDLHLKVADCLIARAVIEPEYINCDGLEIKFQSIATSSLVKTYEWDFGVSGTTSDFSIASNPRYTYSTAGEYTVRLITNKGEKCTDTVIQKLKSIPVLFVGSRLMRLVKTCLIHSLTHPRQLMVS
ncbi:MAG: PKD domain-containing protein [bacterium]